MTPQDKTERAIKMREIAETKNRLLGDEIRELAKLLERAADRQEREAGER